MESRLIINDKTLGWLMAFIAVNNILVLTFKLVAIYYALFILILIYTLYKSKINSINYIMLLLYGTCILSIIMNNVPTFFRSWERLVSFILITIILSPFIESIFLNRLKIRLFVYSQWMLQVIIFISFILYFIGINLSGRADFSGITGQSMLIAPIAANVIISTLYYLTNNKVRPKSQQIYFISLFIMGFLSLFLAASRTALIGVIIAIIIYVFLIYKKQINKLIKGSFSVLIITILSFSLWSPYLDNIQKKNAGSVAAGGITSSRDDHWQTRINEFKSSPVFGIGFASISTESEGSTFNKGDGKVETGSSWLNVLSMTGLLGFICFTLIWIKDIYYLNLLYNRNKYYSSYLLSLLTFWALHLGAEGYILAAGGFLFFCVWLLLGYIYILGKNPKYLCSVI